MDDVKKLREKLWENGYRPIAILTGKKRPYREGYIEGAKKDPPDAVVEPVYAFCASTAILCQGLRAIDIDVDDPGLCESIQKAALEIFGPCPIRYREDSPRRLFLYKNTSCDASKKLISFENGQNIEILGCRQKFLSFGQHESGAQYQWVNDYSPLSLRAEDLVEFDEEKINLLRSVCSSLSPLKQEKIRNSFLDIPFLQQAIPESQGRNYALAALSSIENELAQCLKGGRNNLLCSNSFRLATFSARGWLGISECQNALRRACEANGLIKQDGIGSFVKTFQSGWSAGISNPANDPTDKWERNSNYFRPISCPGIPDASVIDSKISNTLPTDTICQEILDTSNDLFEESSCQVILDDSLTHPPGILGYLIDWITETGPTPNRRLALSSALALTSMLLGRNISTPTDGSLEMYVILTSPTGGGKGHQPRAINSLIEKLKLERHMGDDEFQSGAYLEDLIQQKPLCLSIQDEFGQILSQITAHNASLNLSRISTILRKLLGINFDVYRTGGAKSRPSIAVYSPHLTLYGLSTSIQLFKSIKSKDISNGLLNRFLLIDGGDERLFHDKKEGISVRNPPPELLRDLYKLYSIGAPKTGNLSGFFDKNIGQRPAIFKVEWQSIDAKNVYLEFREECSLIINEDSDLGEVYARTAFYSIKLATILACCENPDNPLVTTSHMEWSKKLAKESADRFFYHAKKNMIDPLSYSEIFDKIIAILSTSNPEGLPPRSMQRRKLFDKIKNYCGKSASDPSNCLRELERSQKIYCHMVGKISIVTLL